MSEVEATTKDAREALERYFGFRRFLDGQEKVVSALVSGRDAMVVMPTGGGKSLCYQLPALVMDGVTVVVSPLIALMKDQVDGLVAKGIAATMINSTVGPDEQRERIERMRAGEFRLVYIAPERFRSRAFLEALQSVDIALFAVDEAHCLSQWGHDFRPDYLRLGHVLEQLGQPQTAAFTATATPEVREDVMRVLGLRDPYVGLSGFERPNLSLAVTHAEKRAVKYERLKAIIAEQKTGIVYCATRKKVDEVAGMLREMRVSLIAYHGGLDDAAREKAQNLFIGREKDVVVATNAFGMGIDRADVRFVVHFDVPGSIEAYYQEAGRAGRDGEPAVCELLFNYADTRTQEFFIEGSNPGAGVVADVYGYLHRYADEAHEVRLPIQELADGLGINNTMQVSSALATLGRAGYIERFDISGQRMRGTRLKKPGTEPAALEFDREAMEEKERRDRAKLDAVVRFCYSSECRQGFILKYFGEDDGFECGNCDACREAGGDDRREGTAEEVTNLRKALSGVARMSVKTADGWLPRFGKGKVVQMLVGSRSQEILGSRLDEISTYGMLKGCGSAYVYELLREAEKRGFLRTEKPGDYPLLAITASGEGVMREGGKVEMCWPSRVQKVSAYTGGAGKSGGEPDMALEELGFDQVLFEKLRAKRAAMAEEQGGVPVYVIFSNQTLEFFARLKPTTVESGGRIRGVGAVKAEKYLPEFVDVIREHVEGS